MKLLLELSRPLTMSSKDSPFFGAYGSLPILSMLSLICFFLESTMFLCLLVVNALPVVNENSKAFIRAFISFSPSSFVLASTKPVVLRSLVSKSAIRSRNEGSDFLAASIADESLNTARNSVTSSKSCISCDFPLYLPA